MPLNPLISLILRAERYIIITEEKRKELQKMEIKKLVLHPLQTNCYIVKTAEKSGVVIDPADDGEKILSEAADMGIEIRKILLTHGHFDHAGAAAYIKEATGAPVYIHEADVPMLSDGNKALAFFCPQKPFNPCEADCTLKDGDEIEQDGVIFSVMHTPGHSAGSVCYICKNEGGIDIMFAGDTIFKDSIGRSDGYSGDYIVQQITLDKLKALKEDYLIYPGHGESTTLLTEKKFNPFIADF